MAVNYLFGKNGFWKRLVFCGKLRLLLGHMPFAVWLDLDWFQKKNRKFPVVGAVNLEYLPRLKKRLGTSRIGARNLGRVIDIDTVHFSGLYFEVAPELIGLLIAPKEEVLACDPAFFNSIQAVENIIEFQGAGKKLQLENLAALDFPSYISAWDCLKQLVAKLRGSSVAEISFIEFANCHQEFRRCYLDYKNQHQVFVYNPETYSHIRMFSWIYYQEIKIIAALFPNQSISVHDAGTYQAFFPLLLSSLPPSDLLGIKIAKIFASDQADWEWIGGPFVQKIIASNPSYLPIEFVKLDLTGDLTVAPRADVVIINDVLEHLPNDQVSLSALQKLWDKTEKLLIAHVPLESTPNPTWGHYITFDEKKIRAWANELPGAQFLSDQYRGEGEQTLTAEGYLIVSTTGFKPSASTESFS